MSPDSFRHYTDEELAANWKEMERRAADALASTGEPHTFFRIGGHRFALPAVACKGVVAYRDPTPLPSLPRHLLGITAIRGRPVSMTDLRSLLGMEEGARRHKGHLLLVRVGDEETALKVDWVETVHPVDASALVPAPAQWRGKRRGLVRGEIAAEGSQKGVLLLDPLRCLRSES